MTYQELLLDNNWVSKRHQIIIKGIENANSEFKKWIYVRNLHVHHTYYQEGKLPWEYSHDALTTLCWSCHEELHQNKKIPKRDKNGNAIGELSYCLRCSGAGWFPEFSHVERGICFRCRGAKYEELIINSTE